MNQISAISSLLCLSLGASLSALDYDTDPLRTDWYRNQRENQTVVRERNRAIPSTWWDVRNDLAGQSLGNHTAAGWRPYPAGDLRLAYRSWVAAFERSSPMATRPGSLTVATEDVRQHRQELGFSWRQNTDLFAWMGWHEAVALQIGGIASRLESGTYQVPGGTANSGEDFTFGDPTADLVWRLADGRYWGLTLTTGSSFPIGDTADWINSRGNFAPRAGIAFSGAVDAVSFGLETHGVVMPWKGTVDVSGGVVDHVKTDFYQVGASASLSWRMNSWLRIGAQQTFEARFWSVDNNNLGPIQYGRTRQCDAPSLLFAELLLPEGFTLNVTGGSETFANRDRLHGRGERLVTGASLIWSY